MTFPCKSQKLLAVDSERFVTALKTALLARLAIILDIILYFYDLVWIELFCRRQSFCGHNVVAGRRGWRELDASCSFWDSDVVVVVVFGVVVVLFLLLLLAKKKKKKKNNKKISLNNKKRV